MEQIPTIVTGPAYRFRIQLDNVTYVLAFRYITRTDQWHMDILDAEESPIHTGIKIVRNFDLIARDADSRLPPGGVYGASPGSGPVGRDGLNTTETRMVYLNEQEVALVNSIIFPTASSKDVTFAPTP